MGVKIRKKSIGGEEILMSLFSMKEWLQNLSIHCNIFPQKVQNFKNKANKVNYSI